MKIIVSLWDTKDKCGQCKGEEVELTLDDLYEAAMSKAGRTKSELYNWQVERIEV